MQKSRFWLHASSLAAILAVASFASVPASAHHGWGGNVDQVTDLSGTVTQGVSLAGPHATMKIKAADGTDWNITLAPPSRTTSAGLREDTIPVGTKVTVTGNRSSDPKKFEMKTIRVTVGTKKYDVYPERIATNG